MAGGGGGLEPIVGRSVVTGLWLGCMRRYAGGDAFMSMGQWCRGALGVNLGRLSQMCRRIGVDVRYL